MRVALVASERLPLAPAPGGPIPTYVCGIAPLLAARHEVRVLSAAGAELPVGWPGVRHEVLAVESLAAYRAAVVRALALDPPEVVHVLNRPSIAQAVRKALPAVGVVLGLHNLFTQMPDRLLAQGLLAADRVVTVSGFVGREMQRRCPALGEAWQAVYSGVDPALFVPPWSEAGAALRRELRLAHGLDDCPVVLFVGRLVTAKGPEVAVAAMREVWREHPQATLVLAGGRTFADGEPGALGRRLQQEAGAAGGRLLLVGWLPPGELRGWFAAADLLLCPSQWEEPLARVLYEAMAAGLPIVASDRGGNSEVLSDGLLVQEYREPRAYAACIRRLLADPGLARALGMRGRQRAVAEFGWARVAGELEQIYRRVARANA